MTVLDCSFANFVLPFSFDPDSFEERAEAIKAAQWPAKESAQPLTLWRPEAFPKNAFLPHVEKYLNAEDAVRSPTAVMWHLDDNALRSARGLGAGANGAAIWKLLAGGSGSGIPFRLTRVRLALFGVGVGFLTSRVVVDSDRLEDWQDFLHRFRFVSPQRGRPVLIEPKPTLKPGEESDKGLREIYWQDILQRLMETGTVTTDHGNWWANVFVRSQMLAYAGIFMKSSPGDGEGADEPLVVYRARNFFRHDQPIAPSAEDTSLDHPSVITYARGHHFVCSFDGGTFIGVNSPDHDFWRRDLPQHLDNHYFIAYLLVLQQRFALTLLSEKVAAHWPGTADDSKSGEALRAFRTISDNLHFLAARGLFSQVVQHDHSHRVYRRWQEVLQVDRLHSEVREKVRDMHDQLQLRLDEKRLEEETTQRKQFEIAAAQEGARDRRLNGVIGSLAFLFGIPALALSYIEVAKPDFTGSQLLVYTGVAAAIGLVAAIALYSAFNRRRPSDSPSESSASLSAGELQTAAAKQSRVSS